MNKISLYTLLILIYLGLAKGFSPSNEKTTFIPNKLVLNDLFKGSPLSVLLLDRFKTGFLINTYFFRVRVIHGFKIPVDLVYRVSYNYWKENQNNLGLSIFRRSDQTTDYSTNPMPPGTLFIGDPAYGTWESRDSGEKLWKFHRAYRSFPKFFNWGEFKPSYQFFATLKEFQSNNEKYTGLDNEFGTEGRITKNFIQKTNEKEYKFDLKKHLARFFYIP